MIVSVQPDSCLLSIGLFWRETKRLSGIWWLFSLTIGWRCSVFFLTVCVLGGRPPEKPVTQCTSAKERGWNINMSPQVTWRKEKKVVRVGTFYLCFFLFCQRWRKYFGGAHPILFFFAGNVLDNLGEIGFNNCTRKTQKVTKLNVIIHAL